MSLAPSGFSARTRRLAHNIADQAARGGNRARLRGRIEGLLIAEATFWGTNVTPAYIESEADTIIAAAERRYADARAAASV